MTTEGSKDDRRRIAEDDLQAYADGRVDPTRRAALQALIEADADASDAVDAYRSQHRLVTEAADALAPATVDLRTASLERALAKRLTARSRRPLWRLGQLAAGVALFVAGWLAHDWRATDGAATDGVRLPGYVVVAAGAHDLFAADPVRPVELDEAGSRAEVDWLSAKLGQSIAVPTLEPLGLDFVGSRLHATEHGPLVQFVYEDADARRLSLFMTPHAESAPPIADAQTEVSGETVGYGSNAATDYVVVTEASAAPLAEIAAVVGTGSGRP